MATLASGFRSRGLTFSLQNLNGLNVRGLKDWKPVPKMANVDLESTERRLSFMDKTPHLNNLRPPKNHKELRHIRGPETINNRLLYNQYGVMALSGGWLKSGHLDMIRITINKKLNLTTSFAAWRVDPPHKPITKKGLGKRMGKGKGAIDHYVTTVRAGRILFEVGGALHFAEIEPLLQEVCYKLPVDAIPVSNEILAKLENYFDERERNNINPFNMKRIIKYNMHGSDTWVGRYDKIHYGDYI